LSPSQKKILYVCKSNEKYLLCTVNVDGTGFRESFQVMEADSTWNIDGCFANENEIVYWTSSQFRVYRGDLASRTNSLLAEFAGNGSFSSNNLSATKIALYSSDAGKCYVLDLQQIKVTVSNFLPFMKGQCLWLENGASVLYVTSAEQNEKKQEFRLYDTRTGEETEIIALYGYYCSLMGTIANGTQCLFYIVDAETFEGTIYGFDVKTKSIRNLSAAFSVVKSGGRACPFLSAAVTGSFVRLGEVLENINRKELERTEKKVLAPVALQNGVVKIKIEELRYETTYLDNIAIRSMGRLYTPQNCPESLSMIDGNYYILKRGESIELEFRVAEGTEMVLETTGYYMPLYR